MRIRVFSAEVVTRRGAVVERMRSPVAVATVVVFLDYLSLMVAMPLLPLWADRLGATPLTLGALLTAYAAAQLACAPALGALSDRYGRKPVIVVSLALSAVSLALIALADSLAMLFAARVVGGLGASFVGAAHAIVADRVGPERQAQAMGYLGAAIGTAHAIGPALGGALTQLGPSIPIWAAAMLACGNTVFTWTVLPETRRQPGNTRTGVTMPVQWRELLRSDLIRRLAVIALILGGVGVTLETVLVLFTHRALGWGQTSNAWLHAYHGAVVVIIQLGIVGRCANRFGERRVVLGALGIAALGLILLGFSTRPAPVVIGVGLVGMGTGLVSPLLAALFSRASPPEDRGAVLGFAHGLTALDRLVIPMAASAAFTWFIGSPFIVAGLLCMLGTWLVTAPETDRRTMTNG